MSFTAKMTPGALSNERYSRQILFAGFGAKGQEKISAGRVVVVGCGAIGSAVIGMLARAGVGFIRIIDRDYVELSNLQRQSLFDESDAAESLPKAWAASRKVSMFNSSVAVDTQVADVVPRNVHDLLHGVDVILDATDNFETRYLINDFAVKHKVPWIYAAAVGAYALTMNILPGKTACLSCIFPEPPQGNIETCETSGVLNTAVNLVASIQATEGLKLLVGAKESLSRKMVSFNLWTNERSEICTSIPRRDCVTCAQGKYPHLAGEGRPHITLCGRNSVQIHEKQRKISFTAMEELLKPHGSVRHNDFVLKFWPDAYEITLFPDGRAIIKGTTDIAVARSLYARFFGA